MNITYRMKRSALFAFLFTFTMLLSIQGFADAAPTPAGTQISETVNATYADSTGATYSSNSNTVITVVANAPTLTNVGSSPQTSVPGTTLTDSFTFTNSGNNGSAAAYFQVVGGSSSVSLAGATITGYTYTFNGVTSGNYATLAALNTAIAGTSITSTAPTNTLIVNVTYTQPPSSAIGTFTDTLVANITYPGGGVAPYDWVASTSPDVSATVTNTIAVDTRMDLQMSSSQNSGTGDITFTIKANNGGSTGSRDSQAAGALVGAGGSGILLTSKVPQFGGSPLTLTSTVTVATNATYGWNSGSYQVYYTTNATGASGWTAAASANSAGTVPAGATYVGVYFYGGASGIEFNADSANSTTTNVTNAAATIAYTIAQPTGFGSATAGTVVNIANIIAADNQSTRHILAPGVATTTADSTATASIIAAGVGINNTTAPPTGNYLNGYSNATSNQALSAEAVYTGPCAATCTAASAATTGSYNGVVTASANDDFTARGFTQASFNSVNSSSTVGAPSGATTTAIVSGIPVRNAVTNAGNVSTTITLSATAPTSPGGWTVGLYQDTAGAPGALLAGASVGATSTGTLVLASGAAIGYWAVYTAPSGIASLTRYDGVITATSGAATNTTHNELYHSYIALTSSRSVTATGCPSGVTPAANGVCPGGTLQFVLDYRNIVVGCASGTEAASNACVEVNPSAGTLSLNFDGTGVSAALTTNNWATYTNGLVGAPTETAATGNGASTYVYTPSGPAGATKFVMTVGGAAGRLAPGTNGTVTFQAIVK